MNIKIDIWRHAVPVSGIAGRSGDETFVVGQNCESIIIQGSTVHIQGKSEELILPVSQGVGSVEITKKDANENSKDDERPRVGSRGQGKPRAANRKRAGSGSKEAKREGEEG